MTTRIKEWIKRMKRDRERFFVYAMVTFFSLVLLIALPLTAIFIYQNNVRNNTDTLGVRTELELNVISENIDRRGETALAIAKNKDLINWLSGDDTNEATFIQEIKAVTTGRKGYMGFSVESKNPNQKMTQSDADILADFIDPIINVKESDFAESAFRIYFHPYEETNVLLVSAPVKNRDETILGYLTIAYNNDFIPSTFYADKTEDWLFETTTWSPVAAADKLSMTEANRLLKDSNGLIEGAMENNESNTFFDYTSGNGDQVLGCSRQSDKYPIVMVCGITYQKLNAQIADSMLSTTLIILAIVGVIGLIFFHLFKITNRPLKQMLKECNAMVSGNEDMLFQLPEDNDLRQLAQTFNIYKEKLRHAAYTDPTIDVRNTLAFHIEIEKLIKDRKPFTLFLVDIIKFNHYNQVFSRKTGDEILQIVTGGLKRIFDMHFYRVEGSLLLGINVLEEGDDGIIEEITNLLNEHIVVDQMTFNLNFKMGVYKYISEDTNNFDDVYARVTRALEEAKKRTDEDVVFYNRGIKEEIQRENEVLAVILDHIEKQTINSWFQPIYDVKQRKIISAEFHLLIPESDGEYIHSDEVLEIVEKNRLSNDMASMVLKQCCETYKKINTDNDILNSIGFRLSTQELIEKNYARRALRIIRDAGLKPENIYVGITESMLQYFPNTAIDNMHQLNDAGCMIVMEDFGTSFSSLKYIIELSVKAVKLAGISIDRFVENAKGLRSLKIFSDLLKSWGIMIIAEEVENRKTYDVLVACGIDYIQGNYIAEPLPNKEFIEFVKLSAKE